jgi:dTDP-4-dehydrorhamnose reductase
MKILITGSDGQVGSALVKMLHDYNVIPLTRQICDLRNINQIKYVIDQHKPDLILNTAAYTKVDLAEDEIDIAYSINCDAPRIMAEKALQRNIPLIHFSTDYVFDGKKEGTYTESDSSNPLGVYGKSKLAGDDAIQAIGGQFYIFRTSWVYSNIGDNFYLNIKHLAKELDELKVVKDQIGVPTTSYFIANQIQKIIPKLNQANSGIYHLVPNGYCSRYEFAKAIIKKSYPNFQLSKIKPIYSKDYPTKARRPLNSILDNKNFQRAFMVKFENWESELEKL